MAEEMRSSQPHVVERKNEWWILSLILFVVVGGLLMVFGHWIKWGTLSLQPASTVTVSGYADSKQANEIATFSVGVSATNEDRDAAVEEVNSAIQEVRTSLQSFGIPDEDIQTQNVSVNRMEPPVFEVMRAPGMAPDSESEQVAVWQANNTLEVTLREVDRAEELTAMLQTSPATNVYGPQFRLENRADFESDLLELAVIDAREKAQNIAMASSQDIGRVITVVEGGTSEYGPFPMMAMESSMGRGGGPVVEPGTSQVSKTVTVTFELRPQNPITPWFRGMAK